MDGRQGQERRRRRRRVCNEVSSPPPTSLFFPLSSLPPHLSLLFIFVPLLLSSPSFPLNTSFHPHFSPSPSNISSHSSILFFHLPPIFFPPLSFITLFLFTSPGVISLCLPLSLHPSIPPSPPLPERNRCLSSAQRCFLLTNRARDGERERIEEEEGERVLCD